MLRDQLLVGVLGGGDQLQQGVDVPDVRGAVWDGYATAEDGFDVVQDLSRVWFDAGVDATVVVVADHLDGGIPLGREVVDPGEQCAQAPMQESGIPAGDMKTAVLKIVATDAVGVVLEEGPSPRA